MTKERYQEINKLFAEIDSHKNLVERLVLAQKTIRKQIGCVSVVFDGYTVSVPHDILRDAMCALLKTAEKRLAEAEKAFAEVPE